MRKGITALVVFVVLEYLAILLKIDVFEELNIFVRPQLLLVLLPYLLAFSLIELTTRHSSISAKLTATGVVAILTLTGFLLASFTSNDGIAQGIWQFLGFSATIPFIIYMAVTYSLGRRVQATKARTPNKAL